MSTDAQSPIQLFSYDPRWVQEFEQARLRLLHAADGYVCAVEHVGATAVPGMSARPCIDLLAAVDDVAQMDDVTPCLKALHYSVQTAPQKDFGDVVYLVKPKGPLAHFSVQIVELGSEIWLRNLVIRDWLRSRPDSAASYLRLRRGCISADPDDVARYSRSKAIFFDHVIDQADAHFREMP